MMPFAKKMEKLFFVKIRYHHCFVSVIMVSSGYFVCPHLALRKTWVRDPWCRGDTKYNGNNWNYSESVCLAVCCLFSSVPDNTWCILSSFLAITDTSSMIRKKNFGRSFISAGFCSRLVWHWQGWYSDAHHSTFAFNVLRWFFRIFCFINLNDNGFVLIGKNHEELKEWEIS